MEIHDHKRNRLITAIEILSPVNKRRPGLQPYREKRQRLKDLYEQGAFGKSIDYSGMPPPAFMPEELTWMKAMGCATR